MNEISVTLVGNVVTDLSARVTPGGAEVASFRFASTARRYDREAGRWVDGSTSYVTVSCWRQLARNVVASVSKGDPLVVTGRLRVRTWERDDRRGVSVEVEASSVGHDLARGVTRFTRPPRPARLPDGPEKAALDAATAGAEPSSRPVPSAEVTTAA